MNLLRSSFAAAPACILPALAAGCGKKRAPEQAADSALADWGRALYESGGGDYVARLAADHAGPYYAVGVAMIVLGGVAAWRFRGKGVGFPLMLLGVLVFSLAGTAFRLPLVNAAISLALVALLFVCVVAQYRQSVGVDAIALSVEKARHGDEVKRGIDAQGTAAVGAVRKVVDPAKRRLEAAGKM